MLAANCAVSQTFARDIYILFEKFNEHNSDNLLQQPTEPTQRIAKGSNRNEFCGARLSDFPFVLFLGCGSGAAEYGSNLSGHCFKPELMCRLREFDAVRWFFVCVCRE